jgi:DNA repair protein RecN (Recombination protein N)
MLKSLILENFILIENAKVSFDPGINVITGETGSGKTALIGALALISGGRVDYSKIRKGCTRAFIEAIFDTPPALLPILEEAGIILDDGEELSIQRELQSTGKSRAFVANQSASSALLQKLAPHLFNKVDQHAHQILRSEEGQAAFLDLFIDAGPDVALFQQCWHEEKRLTALLRKSKQEVVEKEKNLAFYRYQKGEIEEVQLKGEDEELFSEYERLSNKVTLTQTSAEILEGIQETLSPKLRKLFSPARALSSHSILKELPDLITTAQVAFDEMVHSLTSFNASLDAEPERLSYLEERLKLIEALKKKYGPSISEILAFAKDLEEKIQRLELLDDHLQKIQEELLQAETKTLDVAGRLTAKRRAGAPILGRELSKALKSLNIPNAEVTIELLPMPRHSQGEDQTLFYLKANQGEKRVPIKDSSSGGELARLLFALTTLLAHKSASATLIFDEIDASVGGETATMMGQSLHGIAKARQVLIITHFPQVASIGENHLRICKIEKEGRTVGFIEPLGPLEREKELLRMMGGHLPNLNEVTK